jgi:hypothetical protein
LHFDQYCKKNIKKANANKILEGCDVSGCVAEKYRQVFQLLVEDSELRNSYTFAHLVPGQTFSQLPVDRTAKIWQLFEDQAKPWSRVIVIAMPSAKPGAPSKDQLAQSAKEFAQSLEAVMVNKKFVNRFVAKGLDCDDVTQRIMGTQNAKEKAKTVAGEPKSNDPHIILWIMVLDC